MDSLHDDVTTLLQRVGREVLLPRLARAADSARLKAPGEVVTAADLAAEAALTERLEQLTPGAFILGEEGASAEPALLLDLATHDAAWLVDPLDGTRHFAEGTGPFGSMLALLRRDTCEAAWIHMPQTNELAYARRGAGAFVQGERIVLPSDGPNDGLRGGLLTRFFPQPLKARAESATGFERTDGVHHCAARRYIDMLLCQEHFAAYWRTLPWDHAPGALLLQEAGGVVRRFDGRPYEPADTAATGLLVASDETTWQTIHASFARG